MIFTFFVSGKSEPKGSTKAFYIKKLGRTVTTSANKNLKDWEQRIATEAQHAIPEGFFTTDRNTAYRVGLMFWFNKPASKSKKIKYMTVKPDYDKLFRSCLDSLTGICYVDDSQVIGVLPQSGEKRYLESYPEVTHGPGVEITIEKVEG